MQLCYIENRQLKEKIKFTKQTRSRKIIGSAATEFRCGGRFYFTVFRSLSTNPKVKALLKSVHICQSYRKNKSGTFFMATVCIRNITLNEYSISAAIAIFVFI